MLQLCMLPDIGQQQSKVACRKSRIGARTCKNDDTYVWIISDVIEA